MDTRMLPRCAASGDRRGGLLGNGGRSPLHVAPLSAAGLLHRAVVHRRVQALRARKELLQQPRLPSVGRAWWLLLGVGLGR